MLFAYCTSDLKFYHFFLLVKTVFYVCVVREQKDIAFGCQHTKLFGLSNIQHCLDFMLFIAVSIFQIMCLINSVVGIMTDVRDGQKLLKTCVGKGSPTGSCFVKRFKGKRLFFWIFITDNSGFIEWMTDSGNEGNSFQRHWIDFKVLCCISEKNCCCVIVKCIWWLQNFHCPIVEMYYLLYERPLFSIVAFILKHYSLKCCDINALYMSDQDMEAAAKL